MKTRINDSIGYFLFAVALGVMMISGCSLFYPKPTHDPLIGFQIDGLFDPYSNKSNKAIWGDCQDYMKQEKIAGPVTTYKDGTGQHAIEIHVGINGTWWEYVLIYDKNDKRIKAIKYADGHYAS
jgi:hypothetical protein